MTIFYGGGSGGSWGNSTSTFTYGSGSYGASSASTTTTYGGTLSYGITWGSNHTYISSSYQQTYPTTCSKCNESVPHLYGSFRNYRLDGNKLICEMCCILDDLQNCLDEPTPETPKVKEEVKNTKLAGYKLMTDQAQKEDVVSKNEGPFGTYKPWNHIDYIPPSKEYFVLK
jgi:hypothetical protein